MTQPGIFSRVFSSTYIHAADGKNKIKMKINLAKRNDFGLL